MRNKQIHLFIEEETKKEIKDASENLGISLSAFIISTCIKEARRLRNGSEWRERNTQSNN